MTTQRIELLYPIDDDVRTPGIRGRKKGRKEGRKEGKKEGSELRYPRNR